MALVRRDFFSEVLEAGTSMSVLLPQAGESQIGVSTSPTGRDRSTDRAEGGFPVLYLLHGLSDDCTAWQRYTSIERYAAELGLAVVMPQVGRSFYADEAHGARYWTFLSEELPSVVESFFRVSPRREDTFVAGLSMGGYGALKWGLRHPERFAAAASLSGALDLVTLQSVQERGAVRAGLRRQRAVRGRRGGRRGRRTRGPPARRARVGTVGHDSPRRARLAAAGSLGSLG